MFKSHFSLVNVSNEYGIHIKIKLRAVFIFSAVVFQHASYTMASDTIHTFMTFVPDTPF